MNWRSIFAEARKQAGPWVGDAVKYRREHPGVFAKAHALAADWHRAAALKNKALAGVSTGKTRRRAKRHAWGNRRAAQWHRQLRRLYEWRAKSTPESLSCAEMMERHDAGPK